MENLYVYALTHTPSALLPCPPLLLSPGWQLIRQHSTTDVHTEWVNSAHAQLWSCEEPEQLLATVFTLNNGEVHIDQHANKLQAAPLEHPVILQTIDAVIKQQDLGEVDHSLKSSFVLGVTDKHTLWSLWRSFFFSPSQLLTAWSPAASLPISYKYIAWDLDLFNNSAPASTHIAAAKGKSAGWC